MRIQRKRAVIAWWLLSVFVSMTLTASLHHHQSAASLSIDCSECEHNVHHSGHFTTGVGNLHQCVLCQFLSMPFVPAVILAVFLSACLIGVALTGRHFFVCYDVGNTQSCRAPPYYI